jgi:hypothetical protein
MPLAVRKTSQQLRDTLTASMWHDDISHSLENHKRPSCSDEGRFENRRGCADVVVSLFSVVVSHELKSICRHRAQRATLERTGSSIASNGTLRVFRTLDSDRYAMTMCDQISICRFVSALSPRSQNVPINNIATCELLFVDSYVFSAA